MIIDKKHLRLTLKLPKSVNFIYGRNKFGSVYLKKEGKEYKKEMVKIIQEEVKNQLWDKVENSYLFMDEIVYMNKVGRDSDNLKKLTQDSITESNCVWTDDTYSLPRTQRVLIDSDNPRIELDITRADYIGIFDNIEEFNNFKNTYCNKCRKGIEKCVPIRDALDGKINKIIYKTEDNYICEQFKVKK